MSLFDLIKATVACGGIAFLIYSYPVVSQVVIISLLTVLWMSYAYRVFGRMLRR